jgi:hypothetical protein
MPDLLEEKSVRLRVTGPFDARTIAGRFGPTRLDGEWLVLAVGGAVHAVVPARHSLEERFLSLLGAAQEGAQTSPTVDPETRR